MSLVSLRSLKFMVSNRVSVMVLGLSVFASTVYAEVKVHDAWVRLLPPSVKTTAAYLTLNSTQLDRLIAVESPIAEKVEMHESVMENGMMSMSQITSVLLTENTDATLSPQGKHLMVIGLKRPLVKGENIELKLSFEKSDPLIVNATVEQK